MLLVLGKFLLRRHPFSQVRVELEFGTVVVDSDELVVKSRE
jgi:hypothetical protein